MLIVFFRAIILYMIIIFSIRLMGKRQLGELQPSELVVTILVSNVATLPIEDVNIPMLMGIIPILTIVCLDVFMSELSLKFKRIRKIVSGSPKIVVRDGIIDQKTLRDLRFSIDDLMESLRALNIFDVS
ncbi:MAG: YetF domain-containing protein, partial [Oscillospiraceae bacterium]